MIPAISPSPVSCQLSIAMSTCKYFREEPRERERKREPTKKTFRIVSIVSSGCLGPTRKSLLLSECQRASLVGETDPRESDTRGEVDHVLVHEPVDDRMIQSSVTLPHFVVLAVLNPAMCHPLTLIRESIGLLEHGEPKQTIRKLKAHKS